MFENILGQRVTEQLSRDLGASVLAPAMLFQGPPASGKGSAALELARILSCENPAAPWNCSCPSCGRHRVLLHPDLLILGSRPFSAEIAAAEAAFLREGGNPAARLLFIRSVRKLTARFSPVLWEDDPKLGKFSSLIGQLEDSLEEMGSAAGEGPGPENNAESRLEALGKISGAILKSAFKLESEGMGETIPIAQIRRAAWWSRLAPSGKRKFLLIENADRMQEGARNSLLKILEEPPGTVSIVLASSRPEALLPTILSRLRPYRFIRRDSPTEVSVIRRVFRDPIRADALETAPPPDRLSPEGNLIASYLDSFLPVSGDVLSALAAFFAASIAMAALAARRKRALSPHQEELVLLGKYCAPLAEAAGLGRPRQDSAGMIAPVLKGTDNFEIRSLFSRFLGRLLTLVSESLRSASSGVLLPLYFDIWKKAVGEAEQGVLTWNQSPALALERLAADLCRGLAGDGNAGGRR